MRVIGRVGGCLVLLLLGPACSDDAAPPPEEAGPPTSTTAAVAHGPPGWSRILKDDAGIALGASPDAVASDGERALLVGADYTGGDHPTGAIWWSDDGRVWQAATTPGTAGPIYAAGIEGDVALAAGQSGYATEDDLLPFLWRSEDGGETWAATDLPDDELGSPAPEMGRPFVSQVVHRGDWWVAAGGSSTGYAGVWISETGASWEQVLESQEGGGFALVDLDDDRLMAWAGDSAWVTDDPSDWGEPHAMELPGEPGWFLSIADGAGWATWEPADGSHLDSELLRSEDEGRTWAVDRGFAVEHPAARVRSVSQHDGLTVLAGFDRGDTPGAWVWADGHGWDGIPRRLRQPPGGLLSLSTEVDGQVVLFGTAPELDRFYVYRP